MTEDTRPDPDQLLADVQREEARAKRGRLRIFFGASAGVGKTYSMLEAARIAHAGGADVVVGYVEPHGRAETERLLEGLERMPPLMTRYRGIERPEFDLDAALRRRAGITLVDELAHSNLLEGDPSPRHPKRWQDVEEMLEAGLDVWATLNVQHVESLNDVVAGITGVRQQETVPDHVLEQAAEIELIDLPPDDLLVRLRSGKVYVPEQIAHALERYFRKPNLIALRELALRLTADRVDAAAREYASRENQSRPSLARDRFLVGVGQDDQAEELVRFGKRFADALDSEWIVVSVETPDMLRLETELRDRRVRVLRLAETLGADTVTLDGTTAASALLQYARTRNVTRIVVGAPTRHGLRALLRRSTADELVRRAGSIDISVIAKREARPPTDSRPDRRLEAPAVQWKRYGWAAVISLICTLVAWLTDPFLGEANLVMFFLLGAAVSGLRYGRGPSVLTAVLNIVCFNFLFVPPRFTLHVSNAEYLVTFIVMLAVAFTIATLMANVRQQSRVAGARERRTALLYGMSRELAATRDVESMANVAAKHVSETFRSRVAVLMPDVEGELRRADKRTGDVAFADPDLSIAQWVYDHGTPAGLGTDALPGAPAIYLPLSSSDRTFGVLAVLPENPRRVLLPEQRHLLDTFAGQVALAVDRAQLASLAESARFAAEAEALRNTLLSSISHDLRTPLAYITGASTALADSSVSLDPETRTRLAQSIAARSRDVTALVSNVLDLVRLESGRVALRREWQSLEDLVGSALQKASGPLGPRRVDIELPPDLPAVHVDAALVSQALFNLLDNIARHTPESTRVHVAAEPDEDCVRLVIEDDGPGLPPGDPERLFTKFHRGRNESDIPGAGLGLAICRAIFDAHGGRISAASRPGGGARFEIALPVTPATEEPVA